MTATTHAQHDTDDRRTQCGLRIKEATEIASRPTCQRCAKGLKALWKDRG